MTIMTPNHRERLDSMKKQLTELGCKEYTFITVELLFYEALDISRNYGNDVGTNELLAALKRVQGNEYMRTKELYRKAVQREKVIKHFMSAFKSALTTSGKTKLRRHQSPEALTI